MSGDPIDDLRALLDPRAILTEPGVLAVASTDWRGKYVGRARAVLKPGTTQEVSAILAWASRTRTPVVPQGGNTGLSGGATPDDTGDAVVLSLGRLNRIRRIDSNGDTITVEAGCILADVQRHAQDAGRLFPLSLGSEGSCQIGGTIATNAGGINVLRYGTMRELVLGLEYVLPDGRIVSKLKGLHKDNAGYDIQRLIIGSEGTLAVITAATLKLVARLRSSATALCGVRHPHEALTLLGLLRTAFGEQITSYEIMGKAEMALIERMMPHLQQPLATRHDWYLFIEVGDTSPATDLAAALSTCLGAALDRSLIENTVMAQTDAQANAIWRLRFAVSECNRRVGFTISHDTAVAVEDVPAFLSQVEARLQASFPEARPLFVGHFGDGNIHVNVLFESPPEADRRSGLTIAVNACIFAAVSEFEGSITAEHGIGIQLRECLPAHAGPELMSLMTGVKQLFDPLGILNPGKVVTSP